MYDGRLNNEPEGEVAEDILHSSTPNHNGETGDYKPGNPLSLYKWLLPTTVHDAVSAS